MISGECAWGAFIKGAKRAVALLQESVEYIWNTPFWWIDLTNAINTMRLLILKIFFLVFGMLDNGILLVFKIFNMPTFFTYFVSPVMEIICYACPYYDGPLVEKKCTLLRQNCKKNLSTMVFLFLYVLHKFVIMLWIAALQLGNWTSVE